MDYNESFSVKDDRAGKPYELWIKSKELTLVEHVHATWEKKKFQRSTNHYLGTICSAAEASLEKRLAEMFLELDVLSEKYYKTNPLAYYPIRNMLPSALVHVERMQRDLDSKGDTDNIEEFDSVDLLVTHFAIKTLIDQIGSIYPASKKTMQVAYFEAKSKPHT